MQINMFCKTFLEILLQFPCSHMCKLKIDDPRTDCHVMRCAFLIGPASGSRYMARLRATGADWGQDTIRIFSQEMTVVVSE